MPDVNFFYYYWRAFCDSSTIKLMLEFYVQS